MCGVGLQGSTLGAELAHLHSVADGEKLIHAEAVAELVGMQQSCNPPSKVNEYAIIMHGRHSARDNVSHLNKPGWLIVNECNLMNND